MPKGRRFCDFDVEITAVACEPGAAGSKVLSVNYRGRAPGGFGHVFGTLTLEAENAGTIELCAVSFRDDGSISNGSGKGTFRRVGDCWTTSLIAYSTLSPTMYIEAVLDLDARTWTGIASEWLPETRTNSRQTLDWSRSWPTSGAA